MRQVAIVDDDDVVAGRLAKLLWRRAVKADVFESASAFQAARDGSDYDAVVIDLDMPDTAGAQWRYAGLELCNKLRRERGDDVALIILTGDAHATLSGSSAANGSDDLLVKDDGLDAAAAAIVDWVDAVIKRRRRAAAV